MICHENTKTRRLIRFRFRDFVISWLSSSLRDGFWIAEPAELAELSCHVGVFGVLGG
jgi:hypothetical protein